MSAAPALTFTALELVALLRSQRGVTEQPPDSNHVLYAVDQGIDGSPWCAALPGWGVDRLTGRKGTWRALWAAYGCQAPYFTPELVKAGRRAGWAVSRDDVRAGDLLFWDFPDSVHRVQHVDVATGPFRNGAVVTIGGNTSSSQRGSQSNGGGVFERVRYSRDLVAAIRLPYASTRKVDDDMPDAKEIADAIMAAPVGGSADDSPGTFAGAQYRVQSELMRVADQLANLGELFYACAFGDKAGADAARATIRRRDVAHPGEPPTV